MANLLNQFSYVLLALMVLVPAGYFALIAKRSALGIVLFAVLVLAVVLTKRALSYGSAGVSSAEQVEGLLLSGKPTLIQFYSNY